MGADHFREALDEALELAASDERIEPLLRAAALQMQFRFPDVDLSLSVSTADSVKWSFDEVAWPPRLELEMDSTVANRYLQGRESLAVALARKQARFRGEARFALLYLPATRLLFEPYRRVVTSEFPQLTAA